MKYLLLLTFLLVPVQTKAGTFEHITAAAIIADWGTTLDIARHPEVTETNRILGDHPSRATVNAYFISKLFLTYYLHNNTWNTVQTVVSLYALDNNLKLGLRVRF
jgi:hypothetical protein